MVRYWSYSSLREEERREGEVYLKSHFAMRQKNDLSAVMALKCGLPVRIEYNTATRTGLIRMSPHCCADMTGAIRLFVAIDPQVVLIHTFAGERPDVSYRNDGPIWRVEE